MSQYLDDLTKTNDQPSDNALREVKELLSVPLKQLEQTNSEINRLEELIRDLKEKQVEIKKSINRYGCILAPIRRVPTDILHTIFWHCLPTHRNPTMAASESPMLLTRVCSSWRSTAMTSPRLWAQIHVPFRKEREMQSIRHDEPVVPLKKVTDILQSRCRGVGEWLSRSGDCPLSISIDCHTHDDWMTGLETYSNRPDNSTMHLFNKLLLYSSRWRSLELKVPLNVYYTLESMLSAGTLLMLVQLRAQVHHSEYRLDVSQIQPSQVLLKAPNLKRISIELPTSVVTPWWRLPNPTQLAPWNDVSHLTLIVPCTLQDCITLFKRYPRLVHCDVSIQTELHPPDNFSIHEMLYLPYLRSLWIKVHGSSLASVLYNQIDGPKLRWIRYQNHTIQRLHHNPEEDDIPASFIQRATNLTKLDIDRYYLTPSNVLDIVQTASQNALTHLSLTSTTMYPVSSEVPDPFGLETLIVDSALDLTPTSQVLLPNLEVFELHMTVASDDTLLRFITSRMNPLSDIAVLRKVKIRFDRLKEQGGLDIDVVEEVQKRAEMAGIQIDVSVQYSKSSLQVERHLNSLSPSFITGYVEDKTDRTWPYQELEEDEYDGGIIYSSN